MKLILDLQFFAGEKTEKATPKKRLDEREKGKVVKSQDVNTAILLLLCFLGFMAFGSFMKEGMMNLYTDGFTEYIHWDLTAANVHQMFVKYTLDAVKIVIPIMLIALVGGLAANLMQVGFLFTTEPLKFDLKKLDPIKGAKRIFSIRALVELLKSFFKIGLIGTITFGILWINRDEMMLLPFKTPEIALAFFGQIALTMGLAATLALLFLAVFDYAYQRYDHEKNLRMSKQDIKDEYKSIEGDPLIKSKIKEKQRQMAMRRMMSDVPDADVVITNPTHYSIAIRYDESKGDAPYIVAKGVDSIALRIREVAKAHDIQLVENRMLARAIYQEVDINSPIPEIYFQEVAEILAYIYRLEKRVSEM